MLCVAFLVFGLPYHQTGETVRQFRLVTVIGIGIVLIAAFVLGLIALCGTRRCGLRGIFGRAVTGICLNSILLFIVAVAVEGGRRVQVESERSIFAPADAPSLPNSPSVTNYDGMARLFASGEDALEYMSRVGHGDDSLSAQAALEVAKRGRAAFAGYYRAASPLSTTNRMLDMSAVSGISEIEKRAELIRGFADANAGLEGYCTNISHLFESELLRRGVSTEDMAKQMRGFKNPTQGWPPSLLELFQANRRWAEGESNALSLLETNWGKWTCNQSRKKIIFDNEDTADDFGNLVDDINRAYHDRQRLYGELVSSETNRTAHP
jgi:hypothetical protein